jgi:hypothetical protein
VPREIIPLRKSGLTGCELQENLTILYHPQRHPREHERLLELLAEAAEIDEYSRASHPTEIQELVKQGYGFALIREGTVLDTELITRPIVGVDWTVDTAIVYNKVRHPKTIPVLVRHLKRRLAASTNTSNLHQVVALPMLQRQSASALPVPTMLTRRKCRYWDEVGYRIRAFVTLNSKWIPH